MVVRGIDTAKLAAGQPITLPEYLAIIGIQEVDGQRLFVVEPMAQ